MMGPSGGGLRREADGGPRADVEGFFGDLIGDVAVDAPVSRERLLRALTAVQIAANARRAALRDESPGGVDAVGGATVAPIPAERWTELARAAGLTPTDEIAAREVNRRFAVAACDLRLPPGADPLIVLPQS